MLYDLCECYKDPLTKNKRHVATLKYNVPYSLAKGERKKLNLKKYPKGTYFVLPPNGSNPLTYKRNGSKTTTVEKDRMGISMGNILLPNGSPNIPDSTITKQEELYLQRMYLEGKIATPELIEELPEDF